jgi:arginyl-tRNA synthetase
MFKEKIIAILSKEANIPKEQVEKILEIPPIPEMGDYSFPCFTLANPKKTDELWENTPPDFFIKKSPIEIAGHLKEKLSKQKLPSEIEKIEQKGPYINFFISKKKLAASIISINDSYGQGRQKEKILLEHTSVNPNASPHVGRARNSIIGDSIYRILSFLGNKVERHYYVNDVSKQIAMLALVFEPKDKFDDLLGKYVKISSEIEKNPSLEEKVFELLHKFEAQDKKTVLLFKKIVDTAVKGQKEVFSVIGIEFDYFDYESAFLEHSKIVLEQLEKTGKLFKDENNRLVLDLKMTPLVTKMKAPVLVLTRNDGTGLYPLRDIAYTIEKCKKGRNIIVLGEDQKLYFEQIKEALKLLNKPSPEVVHYSFVLLKDVGKMSTRKGEIVLLEDFLEYAWKKSALEIKNRKTKGDSKKVAIAAVKYAMLKNENNKNITFDLEQSLSFEGNTGPYLQYSYARASSIIKKAKKKKQEKTKINIPELTNQEILLIKKISEFPDIVEQAGISFSPHLIANYSHELAQVFNEFYHNCPVIGDKNESFRLKLVDSFRKTLKNSLYLLGIEVMDEM